MTNSKCCGIHTHVRTRLTQHQLPRTPPAAAATPGTTGICLGHTPPRRSPRSPCERQALRTRASPRPRLPRPSPLPPTARDSTRASCTRAPSKQKQRRPAGGAAGGGRAGAAGSGRAPAATAQRRGRASAAPGAAGRAPRQARGGRAEGATLFTALAQGQGPRPETVSRERAVKCAPTRTRDAGPAGKAPGSGRRSQ